MTGLRLAARLFIWASEGRKKLFGKVRVGEEERMVARCIADLEDSDALLKPVCFLSADGGRLHQTACA